MKLPRHLYEIPLQGEGRGSRRASPRRIRKSIGLSSPGAARRRKSVQVNNMQLAAGGGRGKEDDGVLSVFTCSRFSWILCFCWFPFADLWGWGGGEITTTNPTASQGGWNSNKVHTHFSLHFCMALVRLLPPSW